MKCDKCGIESEDVEKVIDPYIYEIVGNEGEDGEIYKYLCSPCVQELNMGSYLEYKQRCNNIRD